RTREGAPNRSYAAALPPERFAYPRIEETVGDVAGQYGAGRDQRGQEDDDDEPRRVVRLDGAQRLVPESGQTEDFLHDEGPTEKARKLQPREGERRQERVAQRVHHHDAKRRQALRARGAHVILTDDVQHRRALIARERRERGGGEGDDRRE